MSQITNLQYANYLPLLRVGENTTLFQGILPLYSMKRMVILCTNLFKMRKQFAFLNVAFIASIFILSSCQKEDNIPVPKTKTQLLSQSSWKFKNATASGTDISASLQACQKDNIIIFAAAGTGTLDEGANKCNAPDPQTTSLTWSFLSGETVLRVSVALFSGTGNDFTLISLTETELVVSILYTPPVGPSITVIITFQH